MVRSFDSVEYEFPCTNAGDDYGPEFQRNIFFDVSVIKAEFYCSRMLF